MTSQRILYFDVSIYIGRIQVRSATFVSEFRWRAALTSSHLNDQVKGTQMKQYTQLNQEQRYQIYGLKQAGLHLTSAYPIISLEIASLKSSWQLLLRRA
jgi:hypothetical protein